MSAETPQLAVDQLLNKQHPLAKGMKLFMVAGAGPRGPVWHDLSSRKNHGVLAGSPTWGTSEKGVVLDFDPTGDRVEVPSPLDPSGPFTLSIKFFSRGDYVADADYVLIGPGVLGNMIYLNDSPAGFSVFGTGGVSLLDADTAVGEWHHVILTYDGSGNTDGIINGLPLSPSASTSFNSTSADWRIGGRTNNQKWFDGLIEHVGVWDRVLSQGEQYGFYNESRQDYPDLFNSGRRRVFPAAAPPAAGHPTMRRWGGVPHMTPGPVLAGRTW